MIYTTIIGLTAVKQ